MYLISKKYYIKQILPPHWRGTYKENILNVLLTPFFSIYGSFLRYKKSIVKDINMSSQIIVLERKIKDISGSDISYIVDENYLIRVFMSIKVDKIKLLEVIKLVEKYRVRGVGYKIEYINQVAK